MSQNLGEFTEKPIGTPEAPHETGESLEPGSRDASFKVRFSRGEIVV
jgi:hypothetical protein